MARTTLWPAVVLLMLTPALGTADDAKTGFLDLTFANDDGTTSKYVLFVPHDYSPDAKKQYPVILFLHGAGESGDDGKKQSGTGLGPALKKRAKDFPFFAIFPQASSKFPIRDRWTHKSPDGQRAVAILDKTMKDYPIDAKRVYLTGLSMGGYGTWDLAAKYPDRWAAIVPVCGGGDPSKAADFKGVPCWAHHGDKDTAVPVKLSRDMVEALKKAGGEPKYTEYPGVGHNSWDAAYGNDELYKWLLEHKKS